MIADADGPSAPVQGSCSRRFRRFNVRFSDGVARWKTARLEVIGVHREPVAPVDETDPRRRSKARASTKAPVASAMRELREAARGGRSAASSAASTVFFTQGEAESR